MCEETYERHDFALRDDRRLAQGASSPESSGRRGQANQFRQAKGPDKVGTGFRVSRASGASTMSASDTKGPPSAHGPPSSQPSSALVPAAGGDGHSGVRGNLNTMEGSWGGLEEETGVPVKGAADRVDDATRSRVIRGQEQALADANARHVAAAGKMSASAKVRKLRVCGVLSC